MFMLALAAFIPSMNVLGYCFAEKRFLSETEIVSKVIQHVYERYPPLNYGPTRAAIKNSIPYNSLEKFELENKSCCKIVDTTDHQYALFWLDRLRGRAVALVEATYRVESYPEAGSYSEMPAGVMREYHVVTNCGRAWNGI